MARYEIYRIEDIQQRTYYLDSYTNSESQARRISLLNIRFNNPLYRIAFYRNTNNNSFVLPLSYRTNRFLFLFVIAHGILGFSTGSYIETSPLSIIAIIFFLYYIFADAKNVLRFDSIKDIMDYVNMHDLKFYSTIFSKRMIFTLKKDLEEQIN